MEFLLFSIVDLAKIDGRLDLIDLGDCSTLDYWKCYGSETKLSYYSSLDVQKYHKIYRIF